MGLLPAPAPITEPGPYLAINPESDFNRKYPREKELFVFIFVFCLCLSILFFIVKDYNKRLELELLERRRVGRMVVSFLHSQKELMLQAPKNIYKYRNQCSGSVTFWYGSGSGSGSGSCSFYQCRVDICVVSFLHSQKELMLQAPKNIDKHRNHCSRSMTFW
jgi:hypothetical protein